MRNAISDEYHVAGGQSKREDSEAPSLTGLARRKASAMVYRCIHFGNGLNLSGSLKERRRRRGKIMGLKEKCRKERPCPEERHGAGLFKSSNLFGNGERLLNYKKEGQQKIRKLPWRTG